MGLTIYEAQTEPARREALAIAHAANASSHALLYYQARRLSLPLRRRGTWWLLEEDGTPVSTLMCYALEFAHGDTHHAGFGLGSVATRPEARKRGHASRLCQHVIDRAKADGGEVGLLFSAIPPAMYERMGFQVTEAHEWYCSKLQAFAESGAQARLTPIEPLWHLEQLVAWYRRGHRGLRLARTPELLRRSVLENTSDVFLQIEDHGYMRLIDDPEEMEILELFAPNRETAIAALRAAAALTLQQKRPLLKCWLSPERVDTGFFEDQGRATTQPMLWGDVSREGSAFWGSDYF